MYKENRDLKIVEIVLFLCYGWIFSEFSELEALKTSYLLESK